MKIIISFLLFTCLTQQAQAQIQWQHCYGGTARDYCYAIRQTFDSGYILAGYATSNNDDVHGNHGSADFWVVKITAMGDTQWEKCYGGSSAEEAYDIRQTSDSGYVVVGATISNDGDVSGNHGGEDVWVIKISSSGALQWQKCLGGSNDDWAYSVGQTSDGGYIVAGGTTSNDGDVSGNHGGGDVWVIKLTDIGSIVWARCYGGSSGDGAGSVQQTYDGGYLVGAGTNSGDGDVTGYHGGGDFWVVKLAANNSIEWEKSLGSSGGEVGSVAIQTNDSGYIVGGQSWSGGEDVTGYIGLGPSGGDGWVVKLSNIGAIQWSRCVYVSGGDCIRALQQTADGGYIFAGNEVPYIGDAYGIFGKLFNTGAIDWVDTFGVGTAFNSVASNNNGTGIAAGYATANNGVVTGNLGVGNYWVASFGWSTQVEDVLMNSNLIISPSPTNRYINITAQNVINNISVTNMIGQLVFTAVYEIDKVQLNVSELPPGMYFIKINNTETRRFIKE